MLGVTAVDVAAEVLELWSARTCLVSRVASGISNVGDLSVAMQPPCSPLVRPLQASDVADRKRFLTRSALAAARCERRSALAAHCESAKDDRSRSGRQRHRRLDSVRIHPPGRLAGVGRSPPEPQVMLGTNETLNVGYLE